MKTKYSADEVNRITETVFEVTSCLSPTFWEALSDLGSRRDASGEVAALAVATEEVARTLDVEWAVTHDYYAFTEALAQAYEKLVTTDGPDALDVRKLVREALAAAEEE